MSGRGKGGWGIAGYPEEIQSEDENSSVYSTEEIESDDDEDRVYQVLVNGAGPQMQSLEEILNDYIYGDILQKRFQVVEIDENTIQVGDDEGGNELVLEIDADPNDMDALKEELYRIHNDVMDQIHEDLPEEERAQYML
jgi:hypothetical protein